MSESMRIQPITGEIAGSIRVPASKYHLHRALIFGSLAEGTSNIVGRTDGEHIGDTLRSLEDFGIHVEVSESGYRVHGGQYVPRNGLIRVGSSGSTLQFLLGLGCRTTGVAPTYDGHETLRKRPVGPLLDALRQIGIRWESQDKRLPITVYGGLPTGGVLNIPGLLSQWISGLLIVSPFARNETVINIEDPFYERNYLYLTERMLRMFGVEVLRENNDRRWIVPPGQVYRPANVELEPDLSSAAFPLVLAAVHRSSIRLEGLSGVGSHPEGRILEILEECGVPLRVDLETSCVIIENDGVRPKGIEIDIKDVPDLLPVLSVLGSVCDGTMVLKNIESNYLKESDRVSAMLQLRKMGADIEKVENRLIIRGVKRLHGAVIDAQEDHRVQMAFAIAGSVADGETIITPADAFRISYPEFVDDMRSLGFPAYLETERQTTRRTQTMDFPETELLMTRLDRFAKEDPDRTAIIDISRRPEARLTYGHLASWVDRVAGGLQRLGVGSGDVVSFQLPNCWEFAVLSLAVWRLGGMVCPLLPALRERHVKYIVNTSESRVLIVPDEYNGFRHDEMVEAIRSEMPNLAHTLVMSFGDPDDDPASCLCGLGDGEPYVGPPPAGAGASGHAQLLFTSGTTGEPKGVVHTHYTLAKALEAHMRTLRLTGEDVIWVPSPLAHQTGFLYGMAIAFYVGAAAVYQGKWDKRDAVTAIETHGSTFVQAAMPFLVDIVRGLDSPPQGLRLFVATGSKIPRQLAKEGRQRLNSYIVGAWGSTESCLVTVGVPGDPEEKFWQTDGRCIDEMDMRIVDESGNRLPAGQEGRFQVKTEAMFVEYLHHPDWYQAALTSDGYYVTGDLAFIDKEGFLHITGREKDVINRGGEKIPVVEIEEILFQHPDIEDVTIVGMPDPRLGERACAFVVAKGGSVVLSLHEITAYLRNQGVAKILWPERVETVDALPRTPSGKVQKFLLREKIARMIEQEQDREPENTLRS